MSNVALRKVSLDTFMSVYKSCAVFKQGYNDYIHCLGHNVDNFSSMRDQIRYERGRVFAAYTAINKTPKAVWSKGVLAFTAQQHLINAMNDKYLL